MQRLKRVAIALGRVWPDRRVTVEACRSQIGSGALPVDLLASHAVTIDGGAAGSAWFHNYVIYRARDRPVGGEAAMAGLPLPGGWGRNCIHCPVVWQRRILDGGREAAPVGRPAFKAGWGRSAAPGRFELLLSSAYGGAAELSCGFGVTLCPKNLRPLSRYDRVLAMVASAKGRSCALSS